MTLSAGSFLYGFVRKDAAVSSEVKGTLATLQDVVTNIATRQAERPDDVREVCNYVDALTYAWGQIAKPMGQPISTTLLCEAHNRLMRGIRDADKQPGESRSRAPARSPSSVRVFGDRAGVTLTFLVSCNYDWLERHRSDGLRRSAAMRIQVLGPGCHNCKTTEAAAREAIAALGINAEIVKVTDYAEIAKMGVIKTPGLAIDGKVVVSGRVPTAAEVSELLKR